MTPTKDSIAVFLGRGHCGRFSIMICEREHRRRCRFGAPRVNDDIFSFLRALGLSPIEWGEAIRTTGQGSPYIGDILKGAFGKAQAVVVVLSPDDEVRLSPTLLRDDDTEVERDIRMQPRPNVLFEAGMAFAYQSDRTILVEVGSTKPFSDITGRHTIRLNNSRERRKDLADRLTTAGCPVQPPDETWLSVGDFVVTRKHPGDSVSEDGKKPSAKTKYVDIEYPHDSGFQKELEDQGYRVRWCIDRKLSRRLDLEGWSLAKTTDAEGNEVVFKLKDGSAEQTPDQEARSEDLKN